MPQKKNPDVCELVRAKTGRVFGSLVALLTVMKGLPLAYNRDLQEDKEGFFDTVDTLNSTIEVFTGMLSTLRFDTERQPADPSAERGIGGHAHRGLADARFLRRLALLRLLRSFPSATPSGASAAPALCRRLGGKDHRNYQHHQYRKRSRCLHYCLPPFPRAPLPDLGELD